MLQFLTSSLIIIIMQSFLSFYMKKRKNDYNKSIRFKSFSSSVVLSLPSS